MPIVYLEDSRDRASYGITNNVVVFAPRKRAALVDIVVPPVSAGAKDANDNMKLTVYKNDMGLGGNETL